MVIGGKGMINLELINLIDNLSEELQIQAVKQNGSLIKHIDNPSEAIQLEADKQKGDKK